MEYVVEMKHITKQFGNFKANDDITLQVKKGEIHALLGENGAGKSTLMSVLFGLYQPEEGTIQIKGKDVKINNPNDANDIGIGMVHQHFKLVHNFTVLESIILGRETTKGGVLKMDEAKKKVVELSERYKFKIDPDALISDITVGMQQRVEILKMLYCDNEILIFDEPTAVLTPQEISELMIIMKQLVAEGKSIVFITHKLNEIKEVADRCSVLRKGKYIGTVNVAETSKEEMSEMMVGRKVSFGVEKGEQKLGSSALEVKHMSIKSKHTGKNVVNDVSFTVRKGEILCIAGIDGNGQSELVYGITGMMPIDAGEIFLNGKDVTKESIRQKCLDGMSHIPEDRHKDGLILDYTLEQNLVLQRYYTKQFQNHGFIKFDAV
ncbi:MAG: ABC transporter ATP-binding protein, partial [Lachnospiraceae bacterium]|nr:ABC transporter ATP-binding protein [Lachnospiraceae bacterium]